MPSGYLEIPPTSNNDIVPVTTPIYAYYKDEDFQCCTAWSGPGGTPNKNTFTPLTQSNWHIFPDIEGIYIQSLSIPSNPCKALKYCTDGLPYVEVGTPIEDRACKIFGSIRCQRCFKCQYGNVTLDEQCIATNSLDCPDCLTSTQSRLISNQAEFRINHIYDQLLVRAININELTNSPILEILSVDGKLLITRVLQFSLTKIEEYIDISNLPNGFYISRLYNEHNNFQVYRFVK